jgi:hypothetical protein
VATKGVRPFPVAEMSRIVSSPRRREPYGAQEYAPSEAAGKEVSGIEIEDVREEVRRGWKDEVNTLPAPNRNGVSP